MKSPANAGLFLSQYFNTCILEISKGYFALKAAIAFLVKSLNTSLPEMAALSFNKSSQSSVPFQSTFLSSVIASGELFASLVARVLMALSISSAESNTLL